MILLLACTTPGPGAESAETGVETGRDTAETGACADAQPLTWDNFGEGFLLGACSGCHGAEADDRHGAPEAVVFDTVDQAWALADRILARAASSPATMPPSGGVEEEDRVRLQWWLGCGSPDRSAHSKKFGAPRRPFLRAAPGSW